MKAVKNGLRFAFRNQKGEAWYEFYRETCPICGHEGYCLIHEKGEKVVCTRVPSEYSWGRNNQHFLHYLKNKPKRLKIDAVPQVRNMKKKKDHELDRIYRAMIEHLTLTDEHYAHLTGETRQFTDEEIEIRGYRSYPKGSVQLFEDIARTAGLSSTDELLGTPGFFRYKSENFDLVVLKGMESILIPFRNYKNQIVGFQHRVDKVLNQLQLIDGAEGIEAKLVEQPNIVEIYYHGKRIWKGELKLGEETPIMIKGVKKGVLKLRKGMRYFWLSSQDRLDGTGAGSPLPVHVAVPSAKLKNWKVGEPLKASRVWLTEGPIKGDRCAELVQRLYDPEEISDLGDTFICIPGVNQWSLAIPTFEALGVTHINIAIDADAASNPNVYQYLKEMAIDFRKRGYTANLILWNEEEGKGLDDLFLNNKIPHIKRLF